MRIIRFVSSAVVHSVITTFVVALSLSPAYASKDPLLTPSQAKLIEHHKKYLKQYAGAIRESLDGNGSSSALVLIRAKSSLPPMIFVGDDPIGLAEAHAEAMDSADGCIVVYGADLALASEGVSCKLLQQRARERQAQSERSARADDAFAALGKDIDALKSDTRVLAAIAQTASDMLKQHDSLLNANTESLKEQHEAIDKHAELLEKNANSLKRAKSEITKSQAVLGKTMGIVEVQQAELEHVGESLTALDKAYKSTTDVVGKNNEQIDSMIAELNTAFVELQKRLDEMKQRLDTIK